MANLSYLPKRRRALAALGIVLVVGCSAPAEPAGDAPELPSPPAARVCPDGFVSAEDGLACDAVLPTGPCPIGTMPTLGGSCRPVGATSCVAGFVPSPSGWGCVDVLPADVCEGATVEVLGQVTCQPVGDCAAEFPPPGSTLFVDDDYAPAEIDATHFQTIADALSAAPPGAVIAVEAGAYAEVLNITQSVFIAGRCPAQVTLVAPATSGQPGIRVTARGVELRGMTVTGHFNGAVATAGAELELRDMVFDANRVTGLQAKEGATVTLRRSVLRDGFDPDQGVFGYGIFATTGATVSLVSTSIARNRRAGVVVFDPGTRVTAERAVFRDNQPRDNGNDGNAIVLSGGTSAEISASAMTDNGQVSLLIEGTDPTVPTEVVLRDSVIRDTRPHPIGFSPPGQPGHVEYFGWSASAQAHASLRIENSSLVRSGGSGLIAAVSPAAVELTDSVIDQTGVLPDGRGTAGAAIQDGGQLTVVRSAIVGASAIGVQLFGGGVVLDDSLVADTKSQGGGNFGHGIQVSRGASVAAHRSALVGHAGAGILASRGPGELEPPGHVQFEDGIIADGAGYESGAFGRAVDISHAATVELLRSAIANNRQVAVRVADPETVVRITDSLIAGTQSDGLGQAGRAINVQGGGRAELVGSLLRDNRDVALLVGQPSSSARVHDTVIARTQGRAGDGLFGIGVLSVQGGTLELDGVALIGNATIGCAVSAASASINQSLLASNPVALQVQDGSTLLEVDVLSGPPGPLEVLVTHDTQFIDNGARVGAASIPLPDLALD